MIFMRILVFAVVCGLVVAMSGCGSSPLKYFPNFAKEKMPAGRTTLLADVFIVDDIVGDTNKIDVLWNREMGDSILLALSEGLRQKGYPVDRILLTSVGLIVSKGQVFKHVSTFADQHTDEEHLPVGSPPFYVDAEIERDTLTRQSLTSVYRSLIQTSPEAGSERTVIQDAAVLGERSGANTVCIVFVSGFNVSVTQRIKEAESSSSVTVGGVGVQRISRLSVRFYIIDVAGGELLWSDQALVDGGIIYVEKIQHLAADIVDRLP